jgi:hypothetical protein
MHISPRGARLDETSRAGEDPLSAKNEKAPFVPRGVGLVETLFSSICTFHPVGPGWTKPQGMMKSLRHLHPIGSGWWRPLSAKDKKAPFVPRRAGLVETRFHQYAHFTPWGRAGRNLKG